MPLFIDEVVVSIEVDAPAGPGGGHANGGAAGGDTGGGGDRQALVAECVERVLEILRERAER